MRISLQRFCGSDFSSIKDFWVNTFSSEIFLDSESQSKKIWIQIFQPRILIWKWKESESEKSEFRFFRLGFWSRKISTKKTSKEISTKKSLQRNSYQKSQKSSTLDQTNFEKQFLPKNPCRESIYPKKIEEKSLPTNLCREIRTKNLRRVIGWLWTGQTLKRNFFQIISLDESFFKKKSTINLYQKISLEKSEDNFSTKNCLKRNLFQTNFNRNLYQKSIGRNISTTKSLKRNLYNTIFKRNPYQKIFQNIILPKYT